MKRMKLLVYTRSQTPILHWVNLEEIMSMELELILTTDALGLLRIARRIIGATDDFTGDNIAIDIAASLMIMPGLEARLGYAHQKSVQTKDKIFSV